MKTTKNGIEYDYKIRVIEGGAWVGWRLYKHGGVLGADKFVGYLWK